MNYEEIEKLDKIISKRLGKKANTLWRKAIKDLFFANIIKDSITKIYKIADIKIKEDYEIVTEAYVAYTAKQIYEKDKEFITNWLKENVDKEILRKWLEEK